MKFITLLTDFGLRDGYTGVMRGVIYRIAPDAQIADISHNIHPQDVLEGSLVWNRSYAYFPAGTVHVAVVDPGVGTQRRPIAAHIGAYFFVCPDNGLITPILEHAESSEAPVEIVHLNQPRFWLPQISSVFHGRDIFSPVAAHLANGIALNELGTRINDPVRKSQPSPAAIPGGWRGEVVSVDHFGNLRTNLSRNMIPGSPEVRVHVAGREILGLVQTFGEKDPGALVALIDADDDLAISIVDGDAALELDAGIGAPVDLLVE